MTTRSEHHRGSSVPQGTRPDGEPRSTQWDWVEPSVWTERMLTALEQGVKGNKWYSLMDKAARRANLESSYEKVKRKKGAAGVDHVSVPAFEKRRDKEIEHLELALLKGQYQPQAVRRTYVPKTGTKEQRPLGIPTVRDRVVQGAFRHVLEPIFERDFAEHSYGFRPGRSTKDALRRVDQLLKEGHAWVVDIDIKGYFDTLSHERLLTRIKEKIADKSVLRVITRFLKGSIMEGMKYWTPEEGTPQGAVLSPLLANIYLDPLDHLMESERHEMIRYADDMVVLCTTRKEAEQALRKVQTWCTQQGLELHPEKTHIVDATQRGGFDFLGYHFERGYRWPRKKSLKKLKDSIRVKTKRCNGKSMRQIIDDLSPILRGWFNYFKHSHYTTFPPLDGWIRMRLRSILRKRNKLKGRGRGRDHQRWPNAYFAELGLFSLVAAREKACQSS